MNRVISVVLLGATFLLGGCHALMTVNGASSDLTMLKDSSWEGRYVARIDRQEYRMTVHGDVAKHCYVVDAETNGLFKATISIWDTDKYWISLTICDESRNRILKRAEGFEAYFFIPIYCNLVLERDRSGYVIWLVQRHEEISNGGIVSDLPINEIMMKCKGLTMKKIGVLKRE